MAEIKTYARIKPIANYYDDYDCTSNRLYLRVPEACGRESRIYNKTRHAIVNHEFRFHEIFRADTTQQTVFDAVARNIITEFLQGYNGTIFAYGQTGSGKTYSMEGGASKDLDDRGIAPRGISMIFDELRTLQLEDDGSKVSVQVSYLEIYQEVGYDLLKVVKYNGPTNPTFQKVTVADGPGHTASIRNLSVHPVSTEDVAMSFLNKGCTHRKVSETSMNDRSSRSHAVFTVHLTVKKGDILRKSKLHFVDLAGSERVCKTGVIGLQLSEAKYINLSLHYLEGVIIALHQEGITQRNAGRPPTSHLGKSFQSPYGARPMTADGRRSKHIPYRNSLLTMVLKDSLGGNCLTAMLATISLEETNLSESVSTCRFAQRVACIANAATRNEEIDDKSMIKRLRKRVAELEEQNTRLRSEPLDAMNFSGSIDEEEGGSRRGKGTLTDEDKQVCAMITKSFINGDIMDPVSEGITDPVKFRECMKLLKIMLSEQSPQMFGTAKAMDSRMVGTRQRQSTPHAFYHEVHSASVPRRPNTVEFRDDSNTMIKNSTYNPSLKPPKRLTIRPYPLRHQPEVPSGARKMEVQQLHRKLMDLEKRTSAVVNRKAVDAQPKPASASARTYQTPYEKKQLKEATQLNKKVENGMADQREQQQHLRQFYISVAQQEKEAAIETLRHKYDTAKEQLVDQQDYMLKLQKEGANQNLLDIEKVVEKQLRRRQDKMEGQIQELMSQAEGVGNERISAEEGRSAHPHPEKAPLRTLDEKFDSHRKKDGQLKQRDILTVLQKQQSLQKRLQEEIDRQRLAVVTKQMEVKEMATRNKLAEFKRKLLQSSNGKSEDVDGSSPQSQDSGYSSTGQTRITVHNQSNQQRHHTNEDYSNSQYPVQFHNSSSTTSTNAGSSARTANKSSIADETVHDLPESAWATWKAQRMTADEGGSFRMQSSSKKSVYSHSKSGGRDGQVARQHGAAHSTRSATSVQKEAGKAGVIKNRFRLQSDYRNDAFPKKMSQSNRGHQKPSVSVRSGGSAKDATSRGHAWNMQHKEAYKKFTATSAQSSDLLRLKLQSFLRSQANFRRQEMINQEAIKTSQYGNGSSDYYSSDLSRVYNYSGGLAVAPEPVAPKGILKNKTASFS